MKLGIQIILVLFLGIASCMNEECIDLSTDSGKLKSFEVFYSGESDAFLKGEFHYEEYGYIFEGTSYSGYYYQLRVEQINDGLIAFNGTSRAMDDTLNLETTYWRDEAFFIDGQIVKWIFDVRGGEMEFYYNEGLMDSVVYPPFYIQYPFPPYPMEELRVVTYGYTYSQGNCVQYIEAYYEDGTLDEVDTISIEYYDIESNVYIPDQLSYHFHFSGIAMSIFVPWYSYVFDPLFFCAIAAPSQIQRNNKLVKSRGVIQYHYELDNDGRVVYVRVDSIPGGQYLDFFLTYYE